MKPNCTAPEEAVDHQSTEQVDVQARSTCSTPKEIATDQSTDETELQVPSCGTTKEIVTSQPFPTSGPIADNIGLPFSVLKSRIDGAGEMAYSYVLSTVKLEENTLVQHGSAPNFQGDVLTLCTCKHRMRAGRTADEWRGVWLAGFTSRTIHSGKHWLFYLAQIGAAYESHVEMWGNLKPRCRNAKAAHSHYLGDVFKPEIPILEGNARYNPNRYVAPSVHSHRNKPDDVGWHNDINYYRATKYRHPALLYADPCKTFLWNEPTIFLNDNHCRNYSKWSSVNELIGQLRGVEE